MTRKYLAFDIEIAKEVPDRVDWSTHRPLGISCAATLASDADEPILWYGVTTSGGPASQMSRDDATNLLHYIASMVSGGYTVLTWNGLGFDFNILAEETDALEECSRLAFDHVDMMFHVFCTLGYPVGLDRAAQGMHVKGKPKGMTGAMAPKMWAKGEYKAVFDYVAQDVRTSLALARSCEQHHELRWVAHNSKLRTMPLPKGWLTVREAQALLLPDTSWMDDPCPRTKFSGWLLTK